MEPVPSSPRLHSHGSGAGGKGWASTGDMSTRMQQLLGTAHTHNSAPQQLLRSYTQHTTASQEYTQTTAAGQSHTHTHTEATASQD